MTDDQYSWLISYLEEKEYDVFPVPVSWNHTTITKNSADFVTFYNAHKSHNNYVLGFSYGAVIAFMTANITMPKEMILCSLSPDFVEDSEVMPVWLKKYIGKKRFMDTKTRSGKKLAKSLAVETVILYGEKEGKDYPQLKKRCEETSRLAMNSTLVVVKNAPHDISSPAYVEAIKKVI